MFSIPQSSIGNYAKISHIFNALQKKERKLYMCKVANRRVIKRKSKFMFVVVEGAVVFDLLYAIIWHAISPFMTHINTFFMSGYYHSFKNLFYMILPAKNGP